MMLGSEESVTASGHMDRERRTQERDEEPVKASGFCNTSIHFPISNINVQNIIFRSCPISIKSFKAKGKSLSLDSPAEGNLDPPCIDYSVTSFNGE